MKIVILGPQGSGKGTQATLLSKKLGIHTISTGQLLRDEAIKNTPFGRKIKSIIDKGRLVPDDWVLKLLMERIKKRDCKKGFILDGHPRNKYQLEDLKRNIKVDIAFLLNISDKEAIKRLSARRQCKKCGTIYNLITFKPKKSGKCDNCDSRIVQRADDKPAAIKRRLQIFNKDTRAVFDYFLKNKMLIEINGEQSVDKVHKDIMKELKKRVKQKSN